MKATEKGWLSGVGKIKLKGILKEGILLLLCTAS
jgi:hypothetical protein